MSGSASVRSAPDLFSSLSRNVIAPLWALKEKSPYLRHLAWLERSPYRTSGEVDLDQTHRLGRLLAHAGANCPFHRERFRDAGFDPAGFSSLDDLQALPLTTKDDIRENLDSMTAQGVDPAGLVSMTTSGSTGVPLRLRMNEESRQWKRACAIRHDMWTGWKPGERVGAAWGNPDCAKNWRLWLRNALLTRHIPLDTLDMDEDAMLRFNARLLSGRPTLLFGHAHSLYLFAAFIKRAGLPTVVPKGVISTAMVLHGFERAAIERVFQAKVFNRYGCEEASLIASECEAHEGLHVNRDTLVVEIVDRDGKRVPPGTPGAVAVTDLTNTAMPLIRYKVGDVAIMKDAPCSCGRSYPLLSSIEGRMADYVRTPDGRYISGISLTENFAMALEGVKQLQIVQERLDMLRFRIVPENGFGESHRLSLARLVRERFGQSMKHEAEIVESIQSETSGKYRFCISKLSEAPY